MTDIKIYHWGYIDRESRRQKGLRNIDLLQKELQTHPDDFFANFNIARCYGNFRDFDKALHHLQRVMVSPSAQKENPDIYLYAYIMAFMFLEKAGKPEEGRQILGHLLQEDPGYGLGWFYSGKLGFQEGEYRRTVQEMSRFQELGISTHSLDLPRSKIFFESFYWQARAYEKLNEPRKAMEALEKALAYEPGNSHVYTKLAFLCKELGKGKEEIEFLTKRGELRPKSRRARTSGQQV
jgi:tetratricopeptide (TPR) repeat protein